ncbi:acyltransferase family protein [Arthrobacter sp. B3I4]|uniref:acyltransferase family protein n=1 Tax=Arthrobacter sp. B3I4 TaxID=3042267 RepID=UPI0027830533|nr:acyltransferase family protein [Arthrobacter sp. B3I4]MDQ0755557.1 peptidoglycan/LPS O-acetylase OafA/YrhL [Arthrobacter sp. B3I4]
MRQQTGLEAPVPAAAPPKPGRKPGFRPEIQGLRSLAVLMVMTYHIWFGRVSGGVDVFLLVSAFLMTLQFVGRYDDGRPTALLKHWLHLFRRLIPAAVVVVVAVIAASVLFLPRTRWLDIIGQGWASLFYSENWLLQAQATDYYASNHGLASPFQHFWSLSIQGQVFLLWPAIFVGAALVARRHRLKYRPLLGYIFALIFVVSLARSIAFTDGNQTEAYFDTPARLWEFALGTLVALALPALRIPQPWRVGLGWLGLAAMLSCGFLLDVQASFPGSIALWPTLAAACVIVAGQTGSRYGADRFLSTGPLVRLGDMSYALYLWHWPVLVISLAATGRDHAGPLTGAVIIAVSLALAYLTTRFIEKPWRQWKWPELRRRRAVTAIAAALSVAAVPLAGLQLNLYFENQAVLAKAVRNNPGARALLPDFVNQADADAVLLPAPENLGKDWAGLPQPCSGGLEPQDRVLREACAEIPQNGTGKRSVLVWGDSHAEQWLPAIMPVSQDKGWRLYAMLLGGCKPSTTDQHENADCDRFNARVTAEIKRNPPDAIVVVGTAAAPSSAEETLIPGLEASLKTWAELGIDVVLVRDNPRFGFNMADCVVTKGADAPDCRPGREGLVAATSPFDALQETAPGVVTIDMTDLICEPGACPGAVGNMFVYLDNNHLSRTYAASLAPMFRDRLLAATGWD